MILGLPPADHVLGSQAQSLLREHILMRDVFHCTPEELRRLNHIDVATHWAIREAIREEEERQAKRNQKR